MAYRALAQSSRRATLNLQSAFSSSGVMGEDFAASRYYQPPVLPQAPSNDYGYDVITDLSAQPFTESVAPKQQDQGVINIPAHELFADQLTLRDVYLPNDTKKQNSLTKGNVVIMLYRDGCGYCTQFKPIFAQAAQLDKSAKYFIVSTDNEWLQKQFANPKSAFRVQGVPTVVGYRNQKLYSKFGAKRTVENVIRYARGIGIEKVAFMPQA